MLACGETVIFEDSGFFSREEAKLPEVELLLVHIKLTIDRFQPSSPLLVF
jgi:hypothetical protein